MSKQITEYNELREMLKNGNVELTNKQHTKSKLTARERIELFFDKGTFVESGLFVKHRSIQYGMNKRETPADGVVTGYGQIDGRLVYVISQDYKVMNGAVGEMHAEKIVQCQETAMKVGAPIIYILDSDGVRIEEGLDALAGLGKMFYTSSKASGVIPQISIILGNCGGTQIYLPAISDFVFMVDKISYAFMTAPNAIKDDRNITSDEMASANIHSTTSGFSHFFAKDENECMQNLRTLISYLPQNNMEKPEKHECADDLNRLISEFNDIDFDNVNYDMKNIIVQLADNNNFFEIKENFAKNIITGFIRLGGRCVGVVANEPCQNEGKLNINAIDKASRFIRTCDSFNIPVLTLVDVDGYERNINEELNGIVRHSAKLPYVYSEATVPMVTVVINKAIGGAYVAMGSKHVGADIVYAWPNSKIAIMDKEAATNILYAKDIMNADNADNERNNKMREYTENVMTPYIAAGRGFVDDIIEPASTRKLLIASFDMLETKVVNKMKKKHGNMPI